MTTAPVQGVVFHGTDDRVDVVSTDEGNDGEQRNRRPRNERFEKTRGSRRKRVDSQKLDRDPSMAILSLRLLVIVTIRCVGLVDVFASFAETETRQRIGVTVLVAPVVAISAWRWRSVAASTSER